VVRSHRPGDVFELVFPCILEQNLQLVLCILLNALRYADAARIRNSLQTRRHVHTSAEDVPPSLITSPKFTPMWNSTFFPRPVGISICHAALNVDRTAHRIHHAAEFRKHSIASVLDDRPRYSVILGIDQDAQMFL
jgi:hypothetical protein